MGDGECRQQFHHIVFRANELDNQSAPEAILLQAGGKVTTGECYAGKHSQLPDSQHVAGEFLF